MYVFATTGTKYEGPRAKCTATRETPSAAIPMSARMRGCASPGRATKDEKSIIGSSREGKRWRVWPQAMKPKREPEAFR